MSRRIATSDPLIAMTRHAERAGVLRKLGRHVQAAVAYRKASELGTDEMRPLLLKDAAWMERLAAS